MERLSEQTVLSGEAKRLKKAAREAKTATEKTDEMFRAIATRRPESVQTANTTLTLDTEQLIRVIVESVVGVLQKNAVFLHAV